MHRMTVRTGHRRTFLSDLGHNPFKLLMVVLAGIFLMVTLVKVLCPMTNHSIPTPLGDATSPGEMASVLGSSSCLSSAHTGSP